MKMNEDEDEGGCDFSDEFSEELIDKSYCF